MAEKKAFFSPKNSSPHITLNLISGSLMNESEWLYLMSMGDPVSVIMTGEMKTCHLKHL